MGEFRYARKRRKPDHQHAGIRQHACLALTIPKWRCSEEDTWKMAAAAAAVLEAPGVYRAQSGNGPVFMAIMEMQGLHWPFPPRHHLA
jgi:hypothetical protein